MMSPMIKLTLALYMCHEQWALHVVIKLKVFFTFINTPECEQVDFLAVQSGVHLVLLRLIGTPDCE